MVTEIWHEECTDEVKADTFYSLDWQMFPNYKQFL
jgi:hypothetical protein